MDKDFYEMGLLATGLEVRDVQSQGFFRVLVPQLSLRPMEAPWTLEDLFLEALHLKAIIPETLNPEPETVNRVQSLGNDLVLQVCGDASSWRGSVSGF